MTDIKSPRVFISYSQTSEEYKERVRKLVDQLRDDAVDALLDQYELKPGDNLIQYMEKTVVDPSVTKVIALCDQRYAERADNRSGGVGTEATIMSQKVYAQVHATQNKFAAVIFDKDSEGKASLPTMFDGSYYIDMSTPDLEVENYDVLLRFIFDRPLLKKPLLGKLPAHILQDEVLRLNTAPDARAVALAVDKGTTNRILPLFQKYLNGIVEVLMGMLPATSEKLSDPQLFLNVEIAQAEIQRFQPYRSEFAKTLELICDESLTKDLPLEAVLGRFFETIGEIGEQLCHKHSSSGSMFNVIIFGHVEICVEALFCDTTAILLKNNRGIALHDLLNRQFVLSNLRGATVHKPRRFTIFQDSSGIFEQNSRGFMRFGISQKAKLLKTTMPTESLKWSEYCQADLLLWLFSIMNLSDDNKVYPYWWYSSTSVLWQEFPFEIFLRSDSRRRFVLVLEFFGLKNVEEFKQRLDTALVERQTEMNHWGLTPAKLKEMLFYDKLCTRE